MMLADHVVAGVLGELAGGARARSRSRSTGPGSCPRPRAAAALSRSSVMCAAVGRARQEPLDQPGPLVGRVVVEEVAGLGRARDSCRLRSSVTRRRNSASSAGGRPGARLRLATSRRSGRRSSRSAPARGPGRGAAGRRGRGSPGEARRPGRRTPGEPEDRRPIPIRRRCIACLPGSKDAGDPSQGQSGIRKSLAVLSMLDRGQVSAVRARTRRRGSRGRGASGSPGVARGTSHRVSRPSKWPAARVRPSGEKAIGRTPPFWSSACSDPGRRVPELDRTRRRGAARGQGLAVGRIGDLPDGLPEARGSHAPGRSRRPRA